MPREARVQSPTNYYHVMMRGINKENIFKKEEQKRFFATTLKSQSEDELIEIAAYCLMDNHVHLVIKADLSNLAIAIKRINIKYAMKFNHQEDRVGHVFQDRFKSEAILDDNHLLQVIRYVHNNPTKAKIVKLPCDYKWSSYNEYLNRNNIISYKQKEFVLRYISNNINKFVEFHKAKDINEYLDLKEDIEKVRLEKGQEIIQRYLKRKGIIDPNHIIQDADYLDEIIKDLLHSSKLSHRQIAKLLGISNSIVHKVNLDRK